MTPPPCFVIVRLIVVVEKKTGHFSNHPITKGDKAIKGQRVKKSSMYYFSEAPLSLL